ncbi:MAG TPA: CDP-alcohol phosphatidyltransferase family protein [Acidimicrobiia bacterium]|jgi:cardiolipin synthase
MLTVPNVISFVRLLLVPVFLWLLLGSPDSPLAAGLLLGLIGSTDWVDGFLARRLDQVSEVGKLLDPLADRLAVAAALIGGLISGDLPAWFAVALIVREALIAVGAAWVGLAAGRKMEVRRLGKLATLLLYAAISWFFVGRGADLDWIVAAAWIVGIPGLVLYYVVGVQYVGDARRMVTGSR